MIYCIHYQINSIECAYTYTIYTLIKHVYICIYMTMYMHVCVFIYICIYMTKSNLLSSHIASYILSSGVTSWN